MLAITGMVEEQKLPEGWNPSDDSEDDYTPLKKNKGRKRRRSGDEDSDSDLEDDDEEEVDGKNAKVLRKRRSKALKGQTVMKKLKKQAKEAEKCVICKEEVRGPFATGPFAIERENMKHHLVNKHYFPEGGFKEVVRAAEEDIGPGDLLPRDLVGKKFQYTCHLQPCTTRRQGYKDMVLHMANQHNKLKEVMLEDTRPEVAEVVKYLFPLRQGNGYVKKADMKLNDSDGWLGKSNPSNSVIPTPAQQVQLGS